MTSAVITCKAKANMNIPITTISKLSLLFLAFTLILLAEAKSDNMVVKIGAVVDVNSRIGKEEKTAMEIAIGEFNAGLHVHKLSLQFLDYQGDPLRTAYAVENLIKEHEVKAIIGLSKWEEAALVAEIGSRAEVPILSFSSPSITPPFAPRRWPFLIRMAPNDAEQMACIASIIRSYNWRKVVVVYEDNALSGDFGVLTLLSDALQAIGTDIEYHLVLPPFSLFSKPGEVVREELQKLSKVQSRVFIVLQTSFPMVVELFKEAKEMGLLGRDTAWILGSAVPSFLDSANSSVIQSMEGSLGIKEYFSDTSSSFQDFYFEFRRVFRTNYSVEDNFEPGFYALRAYDGINTIIQAIKTMSSDTFSGKMLLNKILSSNFTGFSGNIRFKYGELQQNPLFRIVNVVGKKSYKELDFWIPGFGFTKSLDIAKEEQRNISASGSVELEGLVNWPGDSKQNPKGWVMPTDEKPLIIGVPGRTSFEKFVKVVNESENNYGGFCIELFHMVQKVLNYDLPYKFVPYNGTYDELVNHVYNQTYDAIIGDVTILAERSDKVEFTQPYAESGLSMIVPAKTEESAWIFVKPFTWNMWLVTGAILIYTMFVIWFLEHHSNPEFKGSWKDQISTALLFTFSSLFFAHREKLHSNLTRVVLVVWLFVVLVLNSSYIANLTSMLTIQRLQPNVTDIEWLKKNNLMVGCDGDSFVRNYLENVLHFKPENIKNVSSQYNYEGEFRSGNISAAFLELPYMKVFINQYCKKFTAMTPTYRFGGLGFVFQKGSPIATDVSKAILKLSENGDLKRLEENWFTASRECLNQGNEDKTDRLSINSFWGLYLISGATSTLCFILFLFQLMKKYHIQHREMEDNGNATTPGEESVWDRTVKVAKYLYRGEIIVS